MILRMELTASEKSQTKEQQNDLFQPETPHLATLVLCAPGTA